MSSYIIRYVLLLLSIALVVTGCQQEYSVENGLVAKGSLQAAVSGECLPKKVNGVYKQSTPLNAANTIEVTINVTSVGAFLITTNTVNGYSFSGAGTFASTGSVVVTLQGNGSPLATGTDSFQVQFDNSVCILPVTVISSNTPAAVYTLVNGGMPPNCASAVVQGNYEKHSPVDASNFTDVQVAVAIAGTYSLVATGAGLSFSASGVFAATGVQTVRLRASGAPTVQGVATLTFAPLFGPCSFAVNVNGPAVYTINCAAAIVNGAYTEQSLLDASNTVAVPVTVTVPGYYKLFVTTRGMTFADSGSLSTGLQTILLKGTGSPTTWGTVNLPVGTGGCSVPITVQAIAGSKLWRFTIEGVLYEGPVTSVSTFFSGSSYLFTLNGTSQTPVAGYPFLLTLSKQLPPNATPADYLGIYMSAWPLAQGKASLRMGDFAFGFVADSTIGNLTVNRLTPFEGTFSGTVQDVSGTTLPLTNGYFRH